MAATGVQWAVAYPISGRDRAGQTRPGPRSIPTQPLAALAGALCSAPAWHGGAITARRRDKTVLTDIGSGSVKRYGVETRHGARFPDRQHARRRSAQQAAKWARGMGRQLVDHPAPRPVGFDTQADSPDKARMRTFLCDTTRLVPHKIAPRCHQS